MGSDPSCPSFFPCATSSLLLRVQPPSPSVCQMIVSRAWCMRCPLPETLVRPPPWVHLLLIFPAPAQMALPPGNLLPGALPWPRLGRVPPLGSHRPLGFPIPALTTLTRDSCITRLTTLGCHYLVTFHLLPGVVRTGSRMSQSPLCTLHCPAQGQPRRASGSVC